MTPARLRRQQAAGILIIAAFILALTLLRADWRAIFPPGWWRWYCAGVMPSTLWKARSIVKGLRPVLRASSPSVIGRSAPSLAEMVSTRTASSWGNCGRQRRQGRKPAPIAVSESGKNSTWVRAGRRLGQVGRQNTPVVFTAYTIAASAAGSRAKTAAQA